MEKRWKSTFRHGGRVENSENSISAAAESEKTTKIGFRPWPKSRKRRKLRFGRGRRVENNKNNISAAAETEKTAKNGFPTIGKQQDWRLNQTHVYYY